MNKAGNDSIYTEPEKNSRNFWHRITISLGKLWRSRDELSIKNIRLSHIQYFLSLPILLVLVNMQNNFLKSPETLFGLDWLTLMYMFYCIGIVVMMLVRFSAWNNIIRIFAVSSVVFMAAYLAAQDGFIGLLFLLACWIGVGACVAYSIFIFVFVLNNTERLLGILLIAAFHGIFMCLVGAEISGVFLTKIFPALLMAAAAVCVFSMKQDSLSDVPEKENGALHPGIKLSLPFFILAFIADSASSFVFTYEGISSTFINGLGVFAAIILAIIIQFIFRQSVWHMWNLFFIIAFSSHILILLADPAARSAAFFLHGMIYIGYVSVFYTMGGIHKKYSSLNGLRKNLLMMFSIIAPALAVLGFAESRWPQTVVFLTMICCGVMMFTFLMLSPLFQRHFFTSEWIDDYRSADMSAAGRYLQSLKSAGEPIPDSLFDDFILKTKALTRTERELFRCYFDGKSTQEILEAMFISLSTFKTHNSHIFKKLSISSRDELILYINLIKKSGKSSEIEF